MKILLIGSGSVTTQTNILLTQHGHSILASFAVLTPGALNTFPDYECVLVVSPEASVTTDVLAGVTEKGKPVIIVAGASDGIGSWATATGIQCYPYPLSGMEQNALLEYLTRYASGGIDKGDMYRRQTLGSDLSARINQGMQNIRKIAVSSPKGGTGKTTVAVNLAIAFALSGFTTYLVDADGNVGSFGYHLRMSQIPFRDTLMSVIRDSNSQAGGNGDSAPFSTLANPGKPFSVLANSGRFLNAFANVEVLPTLKILPGLATQNLGSDALQNEEAIDAAIKGLYEAGTAANGVVIMDVGINPSHPIHRAALGNADAISVVLKPELPDIAQGQAWIKMMIDSLASRSSKQIATEFISSRVKVCYNMVFDDRLFTTIHKFLNQSLMDPEHGVGFTIAANGILPEVDKHLAWDSVSSDRLTDIFCWRYKKEHTEDLAAFTDALVNFGTQFLPVLRDAASRVGLVAAPKQAKKRLPFLVGSKG